MTRSPTILEQSFADICERHGLRAFNVGMNTECSTEGRYSASVHWNGFAQSGNPCETASGPSIAAALSAALEKARKDRAPFVTALADEALPEPIQ